jgi:hypothetical protein
MMDSYLFERSRIKDGDAFPVCLIDAIVCPTVSAPIPPRQHNITVVNQSGIPRMISFGGNLSGIVDDINLS